MPESESCYRRHKYRYNTLLNWKVGQMKQHGSVFKLLHADPELSNIFESPYLSQDLVPYMMYSLNKQKRWEFQCNQNILECLQEINENLDVMVFERVSVRSLVDDWKLMAPHFQTALWGSKIRKSYEISKNGDYNEQKFGGVGRYYGSSTKKVRWPPTTMEIVTYHTVQEPRNWKKVYTKDFRKWKWDRHNPTYIRKSEFDPLDLKFEDFDDSDDFEDPKIEENSLEISPEILATPTLKFYNFMDHIIVKSRRKSRHFDGFLIVN